MAKKKTNEHKWRRDPYGRAFESAMTQRQKYIDERDRCEKRLNFLNLEIPRLDSIIAVLGAPKDALQAKTDVPTGQRSPQAAMVGIPDHLMKFFKPKEPVATPGSVPIPDPGGDDDLLPPIEGNPILE